MRLSLKPDTGGSGGAVLFVLHVLATPCLYHGVDGFSTIYIPPPPVSKGFQPPPRYGIAVGEPHPDTLPTAPPKKHSKQVVESFHVQTDIRYRFATTKMSSVVRNAAGNAQEMTFDVTLPKQAFIVSFAMTIDGKVYDGEVKEKKEAKAQYQRAVAKGQSAGHIKQTPRHSNRFDVSVNVANGTAVNFTLTYQQILPRKLGFYEYEMNVQPGQAVEDFKVEVYIQENRPLLFVKTPKLRTSSVLSNTVEVPSELTTVDRPTPTTAHIQYKPTLKQQGQKGVAARFVVQYDVEHADDGDLLVADGYFIHLFTPKPRAPLPKDIIFVLDVSGSMKQGSKLKQVKEAMTAILDDLNKGDRFNIFTFSDGVEKWSRVMTSVKPEVIEKAKKFVGTMRAEGGTNIDAALLAALAELQSREIDKRCGMIFFLTDGDATVGETNTAKIAEHVRENNHLETAIYSLAFGQGANLDSLKTISSQNSGYAKKIYEASDASLQVESLYDEISIVAMKNVSVSYLPTVSKTTETVFPIVHNGTEILIGGCIDLRQQRKELLLEFNDSSSIIDFQADINGIESEGDIDITLEINDIESVTIDDSDESLNPFFTMPRDYAGVVEKMWAFLTIKQMLKEKQKVIEEKDMVEELDKEILAMSLKYKFVTPLTSMVVTKPDSESPVESVLQDEEDMPVEPPSYSMQRSRSRYYSPQLNSLSPPMSSASYKGSGGPIFTPPMSSGSVKVRQGIAYTPPMSPGSFRGRQGIAYRTAYNRKGLTRRKNKGGKKGGRRGRGKGKRRGNIRQTKLAILDKIVLQNGGLTACLEPKKIQSGTYVLAQQGQDFKIALQTECFKNCRQVKPIQLQYTSNGQTTFTNMTFSLAPWVYGPHPDIVFTNITPYSITMSHGGVSVVVERVERRKRMVYSIIVRIASSTPTATGIIDVLNTKPSRKRKQRKLRKGCVKSNADVLLVLANRKAKHYSQ